jgi:hypothetical protein
MKFCTFAASLFFTFVGFAGSAYADATGVFNEIMYHPYTHTHTKGVCGADYSTVTLFAKLRGLSTSHPRKTAM